MPFPLSLWDLSLWLAITAIILLITSELVSPYYGQRGILIDKQTLRGMALFLGVLFMSTVLVRVYLTMSSR